MTALHHLQVRRARRLPVPLPPKPKRPLGPPVLFCWEGVDICGRADIAMTGRTWDEFLDEMADAYVSATISLPFNFLDLIERLVAPADLEGHREDIGSRIMERQEANLDALRQVLDEAKASRSKSVLSRIFRRSA